MSDKHDNEVSCEDCRMAALALLHWNAGDIEALNEVLAPIEGDHQRATAVLIATLQAAFATAPELREPKRIAHLRTVVAKLSGDDDGPKRPPRKIY